MASFRQMLDDLKGHNELNLYNVKGTNIFEHGIIQMLKKMFYLYFKYRFH